MDLGSESPDCKNVAMVLTHQSIGPASLVGLLIIGSAALQYGGLPVVRYDLAKLVQLGRAAHCAWTLKLQAASYKPQASSSKLDKKVI